jgi:hypothetical protein
MNMNKSTQEHVNELCDEGNSLFLIICIHFRIDKICKWLNNKLK